jgi:hypothetical protein
MKQKEISKNRIAKINKSLNKYNDVVLFPEKVAKANETLKRVGLPKEFQQAEKPQ